MRAFTSTEYNLNCIDKPCYVNVKVHRLLVNTWEFGTYRRIGAQSLRCVITQSMKIDEGSVQNLDTLPNQIAAHACFTTM